MFVEWTATGIFHNFTCHWTTLILSFSCSTFPIFGLKCYFYIVRPSTKTLPETPNKEKSTKKKHRERERREAWTDECLVYKVRTTCTVYGHRNRSTFQSNKSQSSNAKWIAVKVDLITASAIVCTLCSWTLSSSFARCGKSFRSILICSDNNVENSLFITLLNSSLN